MTAIEIEKRLPTPTEVRLAIQKNVREKKLLERVLRASEFYTVEVRPLYEQDTKTPASAAAVLPDAGRNPTAN